MTHTSSKNNPPFGSGLHGWSVKSRQTQIRHVGIVDGHDHTTRRRRCPIRPARRYRHASKIMKADLGVALNYIGDIDASAVAAAAAGTAAHAAIGSMRDGITNS